MRVLGFLISACFVVFTVGCGPDKGVVVLEQDRPADPSVDPSFYQQQNSDPLAKETK